MFEFFPFFFLFFLQKHHLVIFSQNLFGVNFSLLSDAFIFWCTLFHLYSVSRQGVLLMSIGNIHTKLSRTAFLKTSIKHIAVYMLSTLRNILYFIETHSYLYFPPKKRANQWFALMRKIFINLHSPIMNLLSFVIFYFSFSPVLRLEKVFVVTSCQGSLGLSISSDGQEAVWFFCSTIIRPPFFFPSRNCDAKHLKVLLPWLKMAHYLWLVPVWFKPP